MGDTCIFDEGTGLRYHTRLASEPTTGENLRSVSAPGISICVRRSAILLALGLCPPGSAHAERAKVRSSTAKSIAFDAAAALNVRSAEVIRLEIPGQVAGGETGEFSVPIPINGQLHSLDLLPSSVRSEVFGVVADMGNGAYVAIEPPAARTLRGFIREIPGSAASASLTDEGLIARVVLPDDSTYWLEPLAGTVAGGQPGDYALYRQDDVLSSGGTCGAAAEVDEVNVPIGAGGSVAGSTLFIAELAIDVDFEFFQAFGAIDAVITHVENIINTMNVQYERDVQIKHVITTVIVRTAEQDPYTAIDGSLLLSQFRSHWVNVQGNVRRDVAHLFTGKNMTSGSPSDPDYYSVIGIAYLGTVCLTTNGYSVVETGCCSSFACKTDLSAHELGHNWAALHCCPGTTMNATLTCSNVFHPTQTVPTILNFRDTRTCLDQGDPLRRLILSSAAPTVSEDGALQLTAIADFQFGENQDVTPDVRWSVEPPTAGTVDLIGQFIPNEVNGGDLCVTINGAYTSGGVTRTAARQILIVDTDVVRAIVVSDPPNGAIDARQSFAPDGSNPTGWIGVDLTYNGDTCLLTAASFAVTQLGGVIPPPGVNTLTPLGPRSVRLVFTDFIEPGARTIVFDTSSSLQVTLSSLPGDVDADGLVSLTDVQRLIDGFQAVGDPLPLQSSDMDQSGLFAAADLLRLTDLLNGAELYEVWLGRQLP